MSNLTPTPSPERLNVMAVAARLGLRYHKARDLMLSGQLGRPIYDKRQLTVPLAGVMQYETKHPDLVPAKEAKRA